MKQYTDIELAHMIATEVDKKGGATYYVGGYVRDFMLGRSSKDIDIEIHGVEPEELKIILSKFGQVVSQGASFGIYNIKGYDIDIAQPRCETVTGRGHKDFEVYVNPFIGTQKAAERRDITINALMQDVLTGEVVDHFGGVSDLQNGIIRHVNSRTFTEDPLRVFRAARFSASLGFEIAPETIRLMSTMDTSSLSHERVYEETKKALFTRCPSKFFEQLKICNQLNPWFAELIPTIDAKQSPKWHPEGDVWTHTMLALDSVAERRSEANNPEALMLAALCHDLGKPMTMVVDKKGIHHYGHETAGITPAKELITRLTNNNSLIKYISNMVAGHMSPHHCFDNQSHLKTTNAMFDASIDAEDLMLLVQADTVASLGKEHAYLENAWLKDRYEQYKERMKEPQVTGADLIALGIKPGPVFTMILENCHKQFLSGQSRESLIKGVATTYRKELNGEMIKSDLADDIDDIEDR